MTQNKTIALLFFVLILASALAVRQSFSTRSLRRELEITRSQLQKKDRDLSKSIKNLDELRMQVEHREKYWEEIELKYQDSLAQSRKKTATATIRYEKLKNTPTPMWTVPELDSIKRAILHAEN